MFAAPFLQLPLFGAKEGPRVQPFHLLTVLRDDPVALTSVTCRVPDMRSGFLAGSQDLLHLIGPPAAFDLDDEIEIAKEMRMTLLMTRVSHRIVLRGPTIMDEIALIGFAKMLFDDLIAAVGMDRIIDGSRMLPDPQPPPLRGHPEASFITADPLTVVDLRENGGHERLRLAIRFGQNIVQAALGEGQTNQVLTDLGQSLIRHEVRHV